MILFPLQDDLEEYILKFSDPEPVYLHDLAHETYIKVMNPRMLSGHIQGRFLSLISRLVHPSMILEIGTYTGYSALCLCEGLAKDGILHTIEKNDEITPIANKYFKQSGFAQQIVLHTGDARNIIPHLSFAFDLIFIDGEKKEYPEYYNLVIDKLRPGGILLADNILWNGKVLLPETSHDKATRKIMEFTRVVNNDKRTENFICPIRDGMMIVIKK